MNPREKADYILSILDIQKKEDIDIDSISHFFGVCVVKRQLTGCSAKLTCSKRSARITISTAVRLEIKTQHAEFV